MSGEIPKNKSRRKPYNPAEQIRADEQALLRDATKGIFFVVIIAVSAGIGALAGWYGEDSYRDAHLPRLSISSSSGIGQDSSGYHFINPVIFAETDKTQYSEFQPFI